jgi:hypothetical protein
MENKYLDLEKLTQEERYMRNQVYYAHGTRRRSYGPDEEKILKEIYDSFGNATHSIKSEDETFKSSGLLKAPQKKDDWFYAIDDMTREFYNKFQKLPNCAQAWSALCSNPPDSYAISQRAGQDDCIFMSGSPLLSKKAFNKRWIKYTSK